MHCATPSRAQLLFIASLLAALVAYGLVYERLSPLPRSRRRIGANLACHAPVIARACASSANIRALFMVISTQEASTQRQLIRSTYGDPSFARPIGWHTVFVIPGPATEELLEECQVYGDMLVAKTASTPKFMLWATTGCGRADLVVKMHHSVLPHPFYLAHYRRTRIDSKADRLHCVMERKDRAVACNSLVMAFKGSLLKNSYDLLEQKDRQHRVHLEDIRSYVSINDSESMLYTVGAVVFFKYHDKVESSWTELWRAVLNAEENDPMDFYV